MVWAILSIGVGIIVLAMGVQFLWAHYRRPVGNEELEWAGFGQHPFRK